MKKYLLLFIPFLMCTISQTKAQVLTSEMETFLEELENTSLEELEKELDEGISGLKSFMGFFQPSQEKIQSIPTEEERFSEPFNIDISAIPLLTSQFEDIGFSQVFEAGKSYLEFQKIGNEVWNTIRTEEGVAEIFTPKKIYFKDGTTTSEGISDNEISFFFKKEWGDMKVVDSVDIDYEIRYTKAYDSLLITKNTKKINYKEGVVKVKKLENNHVYLTISDDFTNEIYIRGLNSNGKPLSESSSSYAPTSDNNSGKELSSMLTILENVQSKLKKDQFKDTQQIKKYLRKQVSKIKPPKDNDGVYHKRIYFNGNVDKIMLYIETEEGADTVSFTATNNTRYKDVLINQTTEHIIFMDEQAKEVFRIDIKPLERIGNRFFIENETFYHLNMATKSLDSLTMLDVFETSNGLVFMRPHEEKGFFTYDATTLKQLSDVELETIWNVSQEYAHAIDSDKVNYTINRKGKLKKIEGVTKILEDPSDGLLLSKFNGKYGFIDVSGEIIVPLIYNDAFSFQEGLAIVENDKGLSGYVDTKNNIVIPLTYISAKPFENGIAFVETGDEYQLIDKTGKIVVATKSRRYFANGSGKMKTHNLGGKEYDAFGKLIPKK